MTSVDPQIDGRVRDPALEKAAPVARQIRSIGVCRSADHRSVVKIIPTARVQSGPKALSVWGLERALEDAAFGEDSGDGVTVVLEVATN